MWASQAKWQEAQDAYEGSEIRAMPQNAQDHDVTPLKNTISIRFLFQISTAQWKTNICPPPETGRV